MSELGQCRKTSSVGGYQTQPLWDASGFGRVGSCADWAEGIVYPDVTEICVFSEGKKKKNKKEKKKRIKLIVTVAF